MKEYKISCENAEVKAEVIKLFIGIGYRNFHTGDQLLDLVTFGAGLVKSVVFGFYEKHPAKQITIEKLRKMAKPTECLVKTDNGWEYKVLPKSLIGDAIKIPKKANFAVESMLNGRDTVALYKQACGGDYRFQSDAEWRAGGYGLSDRTPTWQRTEKSKFLCLNTEIVSSVKTKNSFELPGGTVKVVFNEENNQNYHAVNGDGLLWCLSAYDKAWYTSGCAGYLEEESTRTVWEINPQPQPKSKFIVKAKFGYEVQELPKDTPVTWYCIPLVDGATELDQIEFYELCDKVEAVDPRGAKWMRENIRAYSHDLLECFTFMDTPQGIHYWRLINDLIK